MRNFSFAAAAVIVLWALGSPAGAQAAEIVVLAAAAVEQPLEAVVHAFEPQSGCIKLAGGCRKPWCQVAFPGLSGERVGWVDSKNLAPAGSSCTN